MQSPDDGEWQNKHDYVRDNVWQGAPDEECLFIDALDILYGWQSPVGGEWLARSKVRNETGDAGTGKDSDRECNYHMDGLLRKKSTVQKADCHLRDPDGNVIPC